MQDWNFLRYCNQFIIGLCNLMQLAVRYAVFVSVAVLHSGFVSLLKFYHILLL